MTEPLPPLTDEEAEAWAALAAEYPHLETRLIRLLADRRRDKAEIARLRLGAFDDTNYLQARIAELEDKLRVGNIGLETVIAGQQARIAELEWVLAEVEKLDPWAGEHVRAALAALDPKEPEA